MNTAKKKDGDFNVYDYVCEGCRSEGELNVHTETGRFDCPAKCGAVYVQWQNPASGNTELMCVVRPIFREAAA